jgi:hypothetical protein
MAAAKKVLRYLEFRNKGPLKWCALDHAHQDTIFGYAHASLNDIPATRLSCIGHVLMVNGGAISWRSTKVPLNCHESPSSQRRGNKAVRLSSAAQECVCLCKLCIYMGFHQHRPTERVCCLLVLNTVTSTPQWIRQPKPRVSSSTKTTRPHKEPL